MTNGAVVSGFERAFAECVGAKYCVAAANGTVTLQAALVALGIEPGDRVAAPPLTMAATTIAVLNVGAVPVFADVDPATWLYSGAPGGRIDAAIPVSLFGLHSRAIGNHSIDDAAQTLRPAQVRGYTSYSFQASKILALGEGGMLATNDADAAQRAREYLNLGYRLAPGSSMIDSRVIRSPDYRRHYVLGINGRMNDLTAVEGLRQIVRVHDLLDIRIECATMYHEAIAGVDWITPQHIPEGAHHDYWAFAVALDSAERWKPLARAIGLRGGERPYACWLPTYREPALRHLAPDGACPVAESLQPRIMAFQTNNLASARQNASALARALADV